MNIVHLIFSFNTGGTETMLVDILNHQSRSSRMYLIVINNEFSEFLVSLLVPEIKVFYLKRKPGSRNPIPLLRLNLLLRRIRPDVVHMHNENICQTLIPMLSGAFKTFLTVHGLNIPCDNVANYDRVVAISGAVRKDLSSRCGAKAMVIENGISFDKIRKKERPVPFGQPVRLVQVSRLVHEKKGQHLLVEALAIMKEKQITAEATFIGEGPSLKFLKELACKMNVEESCLFIGLMERRQIYDILADFDIMVQPSLYEGFGLTVLEGLAAGIPVVASDDGGPREILEDGKKGWLFKTGDSLSLAEILGQLVVKIDESIIRQKVADAYDYARKRYDIGATSAGYLDAYRQDVVSSTK